MQRRYMGVSPQDSAQANLIQRAVQRTEPVLIRLVKLNHGLLSVHDQIEQTMALRMQELDDVLRRLGEKTSLLSRMLNRGAPT